VRTHRLKTRLAVMTLALLSAFGADAAGLGRLNIQSALGQVLNAEIELVAVKRGETVTARLAPPEVYQQANAQLNPALAGTRVTVEKRGNGDPYLKITTPRPVQEPYVELIVELNSESGRVTRQYTALLDPPGYGRGAADVPPRPEVQPPAVTLPQTPSERSAPQSERATDAPASLAPVEAPASAGTPASDAIPAPAAPLPAPAAEAPPAPAAPRAPNRSKAEPATSAGAKEYGPIKPGETLTRIARRVKPEGATLQQTLIALQRQNPDAFIRKNINLVRSGKILKIPEPGDIAAVPQTEAVRQVRLQVADFNAFRNRLAENVAAAPEGGAPNRGRIGAAVSDPGSAEPKDTVRVSRGEPTGKDAKRNPDDRIRVLEEEAVARQRALAEANERIGNLEKTIKDMQRLVELKSAAATNPAKAPEQTASKATQGSKGPLPTDTIVARQSAGDDKTTPAATPAPGVVANARVEPAPSSIGKGASSDVPGAGQTSSSINAPAADKAAPPAEKAASTPAPKPAVTPVTPADNQPGFFEEVLKEPLYLALGAAVALLAALGLVTARRRRAAVVVDRRVDDKIAPAPGAGDVARASAPAAAPAARPDVQERPTTVANASTRPATASRHDNDLDFDLSTSRAAPAGAAGLRKAAESLKAAPGTVESAPRVVPPAQAEVITPEQRSTPDSQPHPVSGITQAPERLPLLAEAVPSKAPNVVDFDLDPAQPVHGPLDTVAAERVSSELPPRDFEFKLDLDNLELAAPNEPKTPPRDDHWYDVQQKFDLAKAYEEMGDRNGARDILQEVVKEGDREQQDKATKLLAALS
jgi:pilus assembly protein FimV